MNFVEITVRNTDTHVTHTSVWPARDFLQLDTLVGMRDFMNRALEPKKPTTFYHWLGAEAEAA